MKVVLDKAYEELESQASIGCSRILYEALTSTRKHYRKNYKVLRCTGKH